MSDGGLTTTSWPMPRRQVGVVDYTLTLKSSNTGDLESFMNR